MFTIAFLTKRIPELTTEEFFDHYRTTHFELASRMPGLISYQQTRIVHGEDAWAQPEGFADYDALSLYSFPSRAAADAAFASAEGRLVDEDTGTFMDWPTVLSIAVHPLRRFEGSET